MGGAQGGLWRTLLGGEGEGELVSMFEGLVQFFSTRDRTVWKGVWRTLLYLL